MAGLRRWSALACTQRTQTHAWVTPAPTLYALKMFNSWTLQVIYIYDPHSCIVGRRSLCLMQLSVLRRNVCRGSYTVPTLLLLVMVLPQVMYMYRIYQLRSRPALIHAVFLAKRPQQRIIIQGGYFSTPSVHTMLCSHADHSNRNHPRH
jgi:hypothetical protein